LPQELDFENLRTCLDNYSAIDLFIRDCGGVRENGKYESQGRKKVSESLVERKLDFRKDDSGLYLLIDTEEVFHFPLEYYPIGFILAYERFVVDSGGNEIMMMEQRGIDPYRVGFPEPKSSILRSVIDNDLIEITFDGRVNLKYHSKYMEPDTNYWIISGFGEDKSL